MKSFIYCVRDKRLSCYGTPTFSTNDPEQQTEAISRGILKGEADSVPGARDCSLYVFGSYDDNAGKFDLLPEPRKLLDYEDFMIKVKDDGQEDGTK